MFLNLSRKSQSRRRLGGALAGLALAGLPLLASAATWQSSDRWGSWQNGGYTLYNNIWGSGYGAQTIWANSYSNWGVWADHPSSGGIKSYPNATRYVGKKVSALTTLSAKVNVNTPANGAWSSTFDVWDTQHKYEIMLWLNYTGTAAGGGNVKPISARYDASGNAVPAYKNVSVGGATWNVFKGTNGANQVFSFLRTSKTNNTTVDVKAILNWLRARGWMGDVTVGDVQYGFEITSSPGGQNFTVNSYGVTVK
jgi:hypothetical protein